MVKGQKKSRESGENDQDEKDRNRQTTSRLILNAISESCPYWFACFGTSYIVMSKGEIYEIYDRNYYLLVSVNFVRCIICIFLLNLLVTI